jgi:hypothetical protein
MNEIIKEEIARISELMNVQILKESEYSDCERFSDNKQKRFVCKRIASLRSKLHSQDGIGLRQIIDRRIEELETKIPDELQTKFIEGAELLFSLGKITQREKDYFIDKKVINNKLVYIDGEWQPINKLNTNYYDLAELLTDLIYREGTNLRSTIQSIINDPSTTLKRMKPTLESMLSEYFKDTKEFLDYTKNIQKTSAIGEKAENDVKEYLESNGFKSLYDGGNGDLIDMAFGTDLIMQHPELGVKTIQVKNSERAWNRDDEYKNVDWVVIANPLTIYDNKTKEQITL